MIISIFSLFGGISSCQFVSPARSDATMEAYIRNLVSAYLITPILNFNASKTVPYYYEEWHTGLRYDFYQEGENWHCTVSQVENDTHPRVVGNLNVSLEWISGTVTVTGTILEDGGYRTSVSGSIEDWNGIFRVETDKNGSPLNWGEATFTGKMGPVITTGSYL